MAVGSGERTGNYRPADDLPFPVGVLIARMDGGNLHLGLWYRPALDESASLHLAWDNDLRVNWSYPGLWVTPRIDEMRLDLIAARCELVAERYVGVGISYGQDWRGSSFDRTGELRLAAGAIGLTCATFVLAIFASENIQLIDENDWPPRPQLAVQLADIARGYPEIAARLRKEAVDGAKRILPQEVFGACTLDVRPVNFADAAEAGRGAITRLATMQPSA